jgi:flagellar hook-length control protein FliK
MTPIFSLPKLPIQVAPVVASLPVQLVNFDALLTESSANTPDTPVVQDNEAAIMVAPEADIDAAIRPLLAAYAGDPTPVSLSVESPATANNELSAPEAESDEAQPAQAECAEMVVPNPIVIPTPIQQPALVATTLAPTVSSTATAIAKANQPPKVAIPKGSPPVMEPDVEIAAHTQDPLLRGNNAGAILTAELAALFAATPVENNAVSGAGFQTIMTERIAETAIRPVTDASAVVADRALDVARGSLWLDQLAGDIAAVQDNNRDLSFRMIPAQLGQLDVKIASRDDGMQLNFNTQTEEAARIIGSAQARLVEELRAQGVRVAGSEVNTGSGQQSFAQQNGHSARAATIAEFERPLFQSPKQTQEQTHANDPQNGRFA